MERWPNFFIVGANKAGTTSIYEYLKNMPEIYMSPVKEPNYFSIKTVHGNIHRDKKKYLSLFENVKDEKIVGESSTAYLTDPVAPKLIYQIVPNASILICFRDPVERAYSGYFYERRMHQIFLPSFHQEIELELKLWKDDMTPNTELLRRGLYSENTKRYFEIFGRKQVKILFFEEFVQNPKETIEEILRFLGLNQTINEIVEEVHNPYFGARGSVAENILSSKKISKIAKKLVTTSTRKYLRNKLYKRQPKPKMELEDKNALIKFYHNDVEKLQTLLGRKLPWPNFQNN